MSDKTLHFKIDLQRITLDDLIALESKPSLRFMRDLMARHLQNGKGVYLDFEQAQTLLGTLNVSELNGVMTDFGQAVQNLQEQAVNPTSGGN